MMLAALALPAMPERKTQFREVVIVEQRNDSEIDVVRREDIRVLA